MSANYIQLALVSNSSYIVRPGYVMLAVHYLLVVDHPWDSGKTLLGMVGDHPMDGR